MTYDVVIAGGGPVGSFLACELSLAGVSVLLLEKNESVTTPFKNGWMGARGLNFPSVEAFYRRGLLDEVKASSFAWMSGTDRPGLQFAGEGKVAAPASSAPRFGGHFAGIMLDANKLDFSNQRWVLPGPFLGGGMVSLEAIEDLLSAHATKLGVDLRRGHEITGFIETENSIVVQTNKGEFEARWLAGCDGGRSLIRKLAGFEFEGTEPELTGYMATVEFEDLDALAYGFHLTPRGLYTHGPAHGRIGVVDFDCGRFDRSSEITLENLLVVTQRTREMAIRMVLGARPAAVLSAVLRQFFWPLTVGLTAGTTLAALGSKLLRVGLYGVSNLDPWSYLGALVLLGVMAALAMLLPAARTLRLNLASLLHHE